MIFFCNSKSASRKEAVRARISSAVFRVSINFLWSFLLITSSGFSAGSPVNTVIDASSPRLGREAWFRALCTKGITQALTIEKGGIQREGFQDLQDFPIHPFYRLCLMNISCHEVMNIRRLNSEWLDSWNEWSGHWHGTNLVQMSCTNPATLEQRQKLSLHDKEWVLQTDSDCLWWQEFSEKSQEHGCFWWSTWFLFSAWIALSNGRGIEASRLPKQCKHLSQKCVTSFCNSGQ